MIRKMKIEDYYNVYKLWEVAEEVCINPKDDTYEKIALFLTRNPELCYVAVEEENIVGAIMAAYDGYHTVVASNVRKKGIGTQLVDKVLDQFEKMGVSEIDLLAVGSNTVGNEFWEKRGFAQKHYRRICL